MTVPLSQATSVDVRRRGRVYGYRTWRPEDDYRTVEFGYGGQTIRPMAVRDAEHDDCQPWADVIAEGPIVLVEGAMTDAELDVLERAVIAGEWTRLLALAGANPRVRVDRQGVARCARAGPRPRYNIADGGLDNPAHIPRWVAYEQRWQRDDAAGRPRWVPPKDRVLVPAQRRPAYVQVRVSLAGRARAAMSRRLAVWWSRAWPWVAGWTATAAAVSVGCLVWVDAASVQDAVTVGPVAATGLVVWVAARRKPKRRSKARKTRRRKGGKR